MAQQKTQMHLADQPETILSELQAKKMQLHWLLQITKAINYNFSTKQLLDVYEHVLHAQLVVEKLALLVHEDRWRCSLLYGTDKSFETVDLNLILQELDKVQNLDHEEQLWIKNFETIIPVYHKEKVLAYALIGNSQTSPIKKKNELVTFIQTITNFIVVAIENNKLTTEQIRQAGIKRELELAAQMQNMLFPKSLPSNEKYVLHATYLPHQEVGGDYYDYLPLNENEFLICMADVSGKGVPAALLMANFQAQLHAYVHHNMALKELIHELNRRVFASAQGEKFITFFIGKYNSLTRELHYINCGHNPPFLVHDKVVYLLNEGTTGLGMFEELPFMNMGKVFIPDNALMLCYTDGVTETENEQEIEYGPDRLREFILKNLHQTDSFEIHNLLKEELFNYKRSKAFTDDITLLSCRFMPSVKK